MKLTRLFEEYWKKGITPELLLQLHKQGIETEHQNGIEIIDGSVRDSFVKRLEKSLETKTDSPGDAAAPSLEHKSGRETQDLTAVIAEMQKKDQAAAGLEVSALYKEANDYLIKGGMLQAIEGFSKYLSMVKPDSQNLENVINANAKIAQAHFNLKRYESAIEYAEKQKELLNQELRNQKSVFGKDRLLSWKVSCLGQIGNCYHQMINRETDPSKKDSLCLAAIKNKQEEIEATSALSYSTTSESGKKEQIGYDRSAIGLYFKKINRFKEAIENYSKAVELFQQSLKDCHDQRNVTRLENKIAHCQTDMSSCFDSNEEKLNCLNLAINTYVKNFSSVENNEGDLKALRYALATAQRLETSQEVKEKYGRLLTQVQEAFRKISQIN